MTKIERGNPSVHPNWDIGGIQRIDKHGAITFPKRMRDRLDVEPGDYLHIGYERDTALRVMANCEIVDSSVNEVDTNKLRPVNRVGFPGPMYVDKPEAEHLQPAWSNIRDDAKVEPGQEFLFVYPVVEDGTNWVYLIERETLRLWLSPST